MKNVIVSVFISLAITACGRQAIPTTPTVESNTPSTEVRIVTIDKRDVVLPEGWQIVSESESGIVVEHDRLGLVSIVQVEDPTDALVKISSRTGEPLVCTGPDGCMAVETIEELEDAPSDDENSINFRAVQYRQRSWAAGSNLLLTLRTPVGPNEQRAISDAAEISRRIHRDIYR